MTRVLEDPPSAPPAEADDDPDGVEQATRPWYASFLPRSLAQGIVGIAALAFLAGAVGYTIGVRTSPEAGTPGEDSVEVGFLRDMSAHHEQAVELSMTMLDKNADPAIEVFAREILRAQAYEIGLMRMRLGAWGYDPASPRGEAMEWMGMRVPVDSMPGMADDDELRLFREAEGAEADALFVALMTDHHRGGVAMASAAAAAADDSWVADTAAAMAAIQTSEIFEMEAARERAGLPADPPGFRPDFEADGTPTDRFHSSHLSDED